MGCFSVKSRESHPHFIESTRSQNFEDNLLLNRITENQIKMLKNKFKTHETQGGLDIKGFKRMMPYINRLSNKAIENTFNEFSGFEKTITWQNFCKTISKYTNGTREEKCKFLYNIFDKNKTGTLKKKDADLLVKHISGIYNGKKASKELLKQFELSETLKFDDFKNWAMANIDISKAVQPFEIIPSPATEKEVFISNMESFEKNGLAVGESYYLICTAWLDAWKSYVRYENINISLQSQRKHNPFSYKFESRPAEINNTLLIDPNCNIKVLSTCKEHEHFEVLTEKAWEDFYKWYKGGPKIKRQCISYKNNLILEIFPPVFKISLKLPSKSYEEIVESFSITKRVRDIKQYIENQKGVLKDHEILLETEDGYIMLSTESELSSFNLKEINICEYKVLSKNSLDTSLYKKAPEDFCEKEAVEYRDKNEWIPGTMFSISDKEYLIKVGWVKKVVSIPRKESYKLRKPEITLINPKTITLSSGLINLGNTCYMNSILQSFIHTPLVSEYFINNPNITDSIANKKAEFRVAKEISMLFLNLKTTTQTKIKPTDFIKEFNNLNLVFNDGNQHDAHEFLVILLNNLHESLCKDNSAVQSSVKTKKMSLSEEQKISDDQWEAYTGIKGSIISSIFASQFRNNLICTECNDKKSIFEMSNYFSLPIPINTDSIHIYITIVPRFIKIFYKVCVTVNKNDDFGVFLRALESKSQVNPRNLVFGFVKSNACYKYFQPVDVSDILSNKNTNLFGFETLTTLESAELQGKPTIPKPKPKNWRNSLEKNDQVDVNVNNEWTVGIVKEIQQDQIVVLQGTPKPVLKVYSKASKTLKYYRSYSKSFNKILIIPVMFVKLFNGEPATFSVPQALSIGCWYNYADMISQLNFISNFYFDCSSVKTIHYCMYNKSYNRCAVCTEDCKGCNLISSYETLERFAYDDLFIRIFFMTDNIADQCQIIDFSHEQNVISLSECFSKYMEKESIEIKCENCSSSTFESQIEIWRLPDILVIHLKRFSFKGSVHKINSLVEFPVTGLDLSYFMINSKKKTGETVANSANNYLYDLYAVVNHIGTINSGHYTTYCQSEAGEWLLFDDEKVYKLNQNIENQLVSSKAYVLFYKRRVFRSINIINTTGL